MPPPTSRNFDFLRPTFDAIAEEAAYAESYVLSDPSTAVWKLRGVVERMVATIYLIRRLPRPFRADLHGSASSPPTPKPTSPPEKQLSFVE